MQPRFFPSHPCKMCWSLRWNVFQNITSIWRKSSGMKPAVTSPQPCWLCSKVTKMRTAKWTPIWPVKKQRYRESKHLLLFLMWTSYMTMQKKRNSTTSDVCGVLPILQILFEAGENTSGINVAAFIDILTQRSGPQLCKSECIMTLWRNRFDLKKKKSKKSHNFITAH